MAAENSPRGPLYEFLVYCQEERERCRNSGEPFDETLFDEALVASLWMLDQGFWCDEALVHETLRTLSEEKPNAIDLTLSLAAALSRIPSRT